MPVGVTIKTRRGTSAEWLAAGDPILDVGEPGLETDTGAVKYGDGESKFSELANVRKQFQNVVTVAKDGVKGSADFICSDSQWEGDDAACIQAAIDYCASNNISDIYINDGVYAPHTQITCNISIKITCSKNTYFVWDITLPGYMFSFSGTVYATLTGSSDISPGATSTTVTSTSGISAGDLILIYDDTQFNPLESLYSTLKTGELHKVVTVDTTTIYFIESVLNTYTMENNLKIKVIKPISVELYNFKASGIDSTSNQIFFLLDYCENSKVVNCTLDKCGYANIYIYDSYNIDVNNCEITNSEVPGLGYGVSVNNSSAHIRIHDNTIHKCRHCVAVSGNYTIGEPRDVRIYNNDLYSTIGHAVDAHQCTMSIFVYSNSIKSDASNLQYAVRTGSKITEVYNNFMYDCYGVATRGSIQNCVYTIENNHCYRGGYIFNDTVELTTSNSEKFVNIVNNHIFDGISYIAYISRATDINIANNSIDGATQYYGLRLENVNDGLIIGNKISNIHRSGITVADCTNLYIVENVVKNCCQYGAVGELYESGIALRGSSNNIIINNNIISDVTSKMKYGIKEYGTSDNNKITKNNVSGAVTAQISKLGTNTKVSQNTGYTTESTGTATIPAGETSIVVSHGLALTPTNIIVTPRENIGSVWANTFTTTQFTIHCSTAPASDTVVGWSSVV